ncbi:MAG: hypothetical protein KBT48_11605 [Firmicutes bacterium]|nr:hypothetical protein [Bacillota bacterium]
MKTIGIDIGTTTISGVVYDTEIEKVLVSKTVNSHAFIESKNSWEKIQDVECIIHHAKNMLDEFILLHPDVQGIGLSGQMHGILYVDKDGKAKSPLYTWQDTRALQDGVFEDIKASTNTIVAPGYGLVTHIYNVRKDLVPEMTTSFCTIMDYFGMVLTGKITPLVHTSNAASFGFWKIEENQFDLDALEHLKIDTSLLPKFTSNIEILGKYKGIPVTCAIGDNQASFLGALKDDSFVLLNMGTGGQISVKSNTICQGNGIETRPYLNQEYLLVASSLCGGRAYAILENFFRSIFKDATGNESSQYEWMEKVAQENGMKVQTTFSGTRNEPNKTGSIQNITEDNFTPGALIYGVLEGMVQELYDYYVQMPIQAKHLVLSGNGFRKNTLLCTIASQMFMASYSLSENEEEAACGAAKLILYVK